MNFHAFKRFAALVLAIVLALGLSGWGPSNLQETTAALDGSWTGTTSRGWPMSFTVSSSGSQWSNFMLKTDAVVGPCSVTLETTVPGPGSITNGQFSRSGTFSFTGAFITSTTATGTYSYTNQFIYGCGYLNQSGTWTASIPLPRPGDFTKSSPANGAASQPLNLTLSWNPSANASEYQYCYDTSNNGDCNTSWISTGTNTSVSLTGLASNTTYYWQVLASNSTDSTDADNGAWWSFTTLNLPGAFGKSAPANGSTGISTSPALSWETSTGANYYEYCYDTSNDSNCSNWINNGSNTIASLAGLTSNTTYYWHVRAINALGTTFADSASTAFWSFTTMPVPPGAFNKLSPTDNAVDQPTSLLLTWAPSVGATGYQYCYDTSNDNTCAEWTSNGVATSKALSGLTSATTYYWHVRAVNADGLTYAEGAATAFWTFTTLPILTNQPFSDGALDGWILESTETSGLGGTLNKPATTLRVGDDAANKQYRSILSFDTSSLPDNAVIVSVTLRFKNAGKSGTLPFNTHGNLFVDVLRGAFKGNPALQLGDFNVRGTSLVYKAKALTYTNSTVDGWYSQTLLPVDFQFINLTGVTQFRLRFSRDDNNDFGADFLKIHSGNAVLETDRPQLVIEYYVP